MERIRTARDIRHVLKNGVQIRTRWCRLVVLKTDQRVGRLGIIASKRLGSAVHRNRAKRRMREILRNEPLLDSCGADVVVIPQAAVLKEKYDVISQDMHKIIKGICT